MGFNRLVPKVVILNDLERRSGRICVISPQSVASEAHCVEKWRKYPRKKTSRSLSPDEFLLATFDRYLLSPVAPSVCRL